MGKLRVFETFSGIGAQHKALSILKDNSNFDYEIVATSEWDIWANISYNLIHHDGKLVDEHLSTEEKLEYLNKFDHSLDSKVPSNLSVLKRRDGYKDIIDQLYSSYKNSNNRGSILNIKAEELLESTPGRKIDLITYSFPCQDLSVAGSFHGFNQGMARGSGTRSGLLWQIDRLLEEMKVIGKLPKYLLLENVRNMISNKHKKDYVEWLKKLQDFGYKTKTYQLNANEFGIPQIRKRIFAISYLTSDEIDEIDENNILSSSNEIKKYHEMKELKLKDIIKNDYSIKKYKKEALEAIPNKTPSRKQIFLNNPKLYSKKDLTAFSPNGTKKWEMKSVNKKGDFYGGFVRTITTKQDRNPNAGVVDLKDTLLDSSKRNIGVKPKANFRFLTPRETYLLMGFDDDDFDKIISNEKVKIKKEVLYRQAGNSIVVNILVSIFNSLKNIEKED